MWKMETNLSSLGYETTYQNRLAETRSMITLATLLDFLDQGIDDGVSYSSIMQQAYAIAQKANPKGLPKEPSDVSVVSSVIRSNVKIMIYNIIEFSVTNLVNAIYHQLEKEKCGYTEASDSIRSVWLHANLKQLNDPSANNATVEKLSKRLIESIIAKSALCIRPKDTIAGGNLDGDSILKLFDQHGVSINASGTQFNQQELKDIRQRRNDLAHGSVSFTEAGSQVTTAELADLIDHVDSFLTHLRDEVIAYLETKQYRTAT